MTRAGLSLVVVLSLVAYKQKEGDQPAVEPAGSGASAAPAKVTPLALLLVSVIANARRALSRCPSRCRRDRATPGRAPRPGGQRRRSSGKLPACAVFRT
jgi:hypothetical protein